MGDSEHHARCTWGPEVKIFENLKTIWPSKLYFFLTNSKEVTSKKTKSRLGKRNTELVKIVLDPQGFSGPGKWNFPTETGLVTGLYTCNVDNW